MADLKAQLEIGADASGVATAVTQAKRSLADLGQGAATAGRQASAGLDQVGAGAQRSTARVDAATRSIIGSIQRTTAVAEAGGRSTSRYFEALAAQRGVDVNALRPYLDNLDAVTAKSTPAAAAVATTTAALNRGAVSAAQTAAALRGVPAQFTDILTSLQGGQAPLTVLLQQGGQLKDMFGGIGPAARALGGYVAGLVNPFTLAAGAAAALGVAYYQGSKEGDAFARSLILSGNAAGASISMLDGMSASLARLGGTRGAAADALAQVAATGEVASGNLERVAGAALRMERETGQAVSKTVEQFAELGRSPVAASLKLNESTNFLTASLFQQIKALEDQGRASEAASVAQAGYAAAVEGRLGQLEGRLGTIERGWRAVTGAAKGAWDAMLGVGRATTVGSELADAQKALENRQRAQAMQPARGTVGVDAYEAGNKALRDRIAVLSEAARMDERAADASRRSTEREQARIRFIQAGEQYVSKAVRTEREIAKARQDGATAGLSAAEIEGRVAAIREKNADKGAASGAAAAARRAATAAARVERADVAFDISAFRAANNERIASYRAGEQALESIRAAGIISEADYYEQKRAFVRADGEARENELREEIRRRQERKLSGAEEISNAKAIAEAQSRLMIARIENGARLEQLDTQQEASARRQIAAFESIARAAQQSFDVTQQAQQRELASIGLGENARRRAAGISQIEDRYSGERRQVENDRARFIAERTYTDEVRAQTEERLRVIDEFQRRSVESYGAYYDELRRREGEWSAGVNEALVNYVDRSANVFDSVKSVAERSFKGMEDAIVQFGMTGKLSIRDLATSIVADLMRITIQQRIMIPLMQTLAGAGGNPQGIGGAYSGGGGTDWASWLRLGLSAISMFSGGGAGMGMSQIGSGISRGDAGISGGRAEGGRMDAGKSYLVGERGIERVHMGTSPGTVTPTADLAPRVKIINQAGADVGVQTNRDGELEILLRRAVREGALAGRDLVASELGSGRGVTTAALKSRGVNTSGALAKRG